MVLYSCDVCNFKSQYLTRYREHCQTRKHLRNLENHGKDNIMVYNNDCQHNVNTKFSQCQHNVNTKYPHYEQTENIVSMNKNEDHNDNKKYECGMCGISFSTRQSRSRHEKKYCQKLKDKMIILESKLPSDTENNQNVTHINITNNNNTNNIINNTINNLKSFMSIPSSLKNIDKTIKFLNDEYPDVLDFPSFIIKVRDECVLSVEHREILIVTFKESPFLSFTKIFNCVLNQMCVDIGIVPFCCSDSNLRNHKEKHEIGWCNMIETTNLRILIDVVLEKVNQDETYICLLEKQYVQLCNKLKKFFSVNRMRDTSSLPASMDYHKLLVGVGKKDN